MIVDDFHIVGFAVAPPKANAPLIVDADTVLALPIALERFKRIPWRRPQLIKRFDRIKYEQLSPSWPGYSGEASDQLIAEQSLSIAITEALDHKPM